MKYKYLLIILLITACNSVQNKKQSLANYECYEPEYAKGFKLYHKQDTTILKVVNPWQFAQEIEFNYVLTPNASPDIYNEIKTPVQSAVCMSTTHIAFLSALNKHSYIKGISGTNHVSDTTILNLIKGKKIVEIGYDTNLSYELLFSLMPDVVFAYGVQGEFANIEKKLNELGIKVVYIGEYLEDTPLGKAEWLIAVSAFFDNRSAAEELFEKIADSYNSAKEIVKNTTERPKVMLNVPYKDTWYLPGTKSNMVKFITDAGADYIYQSHNKRESLPMSIEKAFIIAQDADYWFISNSSKSLKELKSTDTRMADIPAFINKKVYNSNLRMNPYGGDDFWESGIVKPDVILKDMIKMFYPELIPSHELYFYRHLE